MFAIYKRELKSYFQSFIGFLFIAVTLFFIGLYFSVYNMMGGSPYFSGAVSSATFLLLISVPILTMRTLAEERRSKTDQLILTAPVSVGGIVLGKFLALLTIYAIPMAITCTYPFIMAQYGNPPIGENYMAILAFFLYGMTSIAIGLWLSSLTESQVIAAVLSFIVLFLGYMMNSICGVISSTGNLLTALLGCFDLYTPFTELISGTLNITSIVYYISITALVLFLTVQSIQKRRYSVSVKNFSIGAYSTGMIAVFVAIVIAVNIILSGMPSSWTAIDLTAQKLYSLTDQSIEYVKNMQEDVTIYVLTNEDSQDITLQQTLQRYDDLSEHITVEYVDPTVNPTFHTQYTTSNLSLNSLIVVSDKRSKVVDYNDLYAKSTQINYTTYTYDTTVIGYDGEGQITSALGYVLSEDMPKVYMTTGHNEFTLSSSFTAALDKENVEYETINLMDYDAVPEDAACVLINSAVTDFSADDLKKVTDYLDCGGKVVLILGFAMEELPNIEALAAYMGLSIVDGLVIEQNQTNYYQIPFYILPTQKASAYTSGTYKNTYVFAPYVQGITIDNEEAEGMSYDAFLSTSDSAFAKADAMNNLEDYSKGENDVDGPFHVGVEAVKTLAEGEATMVVYGSEQMFTDEANSMVSGSNLILFANTISNFVDHDASVSIPVKNYDVTSLAINQLHAVLISLVTAMLLPIVCLVAGFVIWFKRRKR